jgi:hypothetical protein
MSRPIHPNLFKIEIIQQIQGQNFENVFWWLNETGTTAADLAESAQSAWEASSAPIAWQTPQCLYIRSIVTDYSAEDDPFQLDWDAGLTGHGTSGATETAPQVALVTTFKSGTAGRSGRGRAYLGGLASEHLTADSTKWNFTTLTDLPLVWDKYFDELETLDSGGNQVVYSRARDEAALSSIFVVNSRESKTRIGTQRRRARRYGTG